MATAVGIGHPPVARAIDPSTTRLAVTSRVYLDLASEGESIGRLDVELFGEAAPRAAENFYELCAREKYAGSQIYKVVSPYNIQGGDIAGSGDKCVKEKSCVSAFGGPFQPEGYEIEHSVSGLLSFSRGLGGEIDSRFVITLADDARWADGRYEAFGRVSSSSADVLKKIEGVTVKPPTNRPEKPIMITGCGVSR